MIESETLQFENARTVQALFANDIKLLKQLEDSLNVKVTTRDAWVRLEGKPSQVERAKRLFLQLERARLRGMEIRRHEFNYALRSVHEEGREHIGDLDDLAGTQVFCSPHRSPVVPKTEGQRAYIRAIQEHDMVFGVGAAGSGKTFLAMAMALEALKKEKVHRIILTRPAVEAGEALGFLPGDLQEKIMPYLRPLYDALHDTLDPEEIQRYIERGMLEIAPLAYMRGRTLNHAFVILDEAQNTTKEQMLMFLTRLGAESKCVVTGDQTQIDLPSHKGSGLVEAIEVLKDLPDIAFCYFEERDVIRHELVQSIVRAYKTHRARPKHPTP